MDKPVKTPRDRVVATAIDRVLTAERECEAAIRDAERTAEERMERARAFRRGLLERTQARITGLHARVAANLEDADAQVHARIAAIRRQDFGGLRQDCVAQAIAALARRLTGGEPPDRGHV